MSHTITTLPQKKFLTRHDFRELDLTENKISNKISYLKNINLLETIKKGVFSNRLFEHNYDEREKVRLAMMLFPSGYVTGYEALRYWGQTAEEYFGLCLRVDQVVDVAVPKVTSKPIQWQGYLFKSFQFSQHLFFGAVQSAYGMVAIPEKAILDLMYMGRTPDNIEFDMINSLKLQEFALRYPPRISRKICH